MPKYKVLKKQPNSKHCIVCGLDNHHGLKSSFYELENGELVAIFSPLNGHQSYPGRLHGGISGAILDETIGRAIMIKDPDVWGVTVELTLKYKKPVPLDEELKVVGRITKDNRLLFEGNGEIILPNGDIAVTATGKYMKMPVDKIAEGFDDGSEWAVSSSEDDPEEIELSDV